LEDVSRSGERVMQGLPFPVMARTEQRAGP
jgi:hypothetical protein